MAKYLDLGRNTDSPPTDTGEQTKACGERTRSDSPFVSIQALPEKHALPCPATSNAAKKTLSCMYHEKADGKENITVKVWHNGIILRVHMVKNYA
jgi:hypothetical protein